MDSIYYVIIAILMALAVSDLVVGVSNDAVNFLNSALGSKVAPRWVIMTVASVGILVGAVCSSGMMEVAREGIFNPGQFDFHSVMIIFLAVMFTDVILLDTFNTLGLPTSTTVSLVFELLGSAVATALIIISRDIPDMATELSAYINSANALKIISGILISVVVAFSCGIVVMFISRLIFSFRFKTTFKYVGAIWCGIALTAISYFAIFKGLGLGKETSHILSDGAKAFINTTPMAVLMGYLFLVWTGILALLQYIFRINTLKITILAGTLSLALAFAGNDLVNFIGVFMAGENTFEFGKAAIESGATMADLQGMKMGALAEPVTANIWYLLSAGLIMIVTLWLSKKARRVTETEINLASQDSDGEKFSSTFVSRGLVHSAVGINKVFNFITPSPVQKWVAKRFEPFTYEGSEKVPFDVIRATVNLATASILIALATSLKLPLSTTYVTFMVAMGSSLADKAWGKETAVYRITGVLTVISGWFLTAFCAFTVSFIVASILMYGGQFAIYGMALLCAYLLWHSRKTFARKRKEQEAKDAAKAEKKSILETSKVDICEALDTISTIYDDTIQGLFDEDFTKVKASYKQSKRFLKQAKERSQMLHSELANLESQDLEAGHYYVQVVDFLNEVAVALIYITRPARQHLDNNHEGFSEQQMADLRKIGEFSHQLYASKSEMLRTGDFSALEKTLAERAEFMELLSEAIKNQIGRVVSKESNSRSSLLYLTIVNETKAMAHHSRNLFDAQRKFAEKR